MLLTCAREDVQVSIIERGDSYHHPVTFMGGQMITMSLDSEQTINPFDLDPGEAEPSNDHLAFLKNLTHYMIGDSGEGDTDLLDNLIHLASTPFMRPLRKQALRLVDEIREALPEESEEK